MSAKHSTRSVVSDRREHTPTPWEDLRAFVRVHADQKPDGSEFIRGMVCQAVNIHNKLNEVEPRIVRAVNAHEALVEQLQSVLSFINDLALEWPEVGGASKWYPRLDELIGGIFTQINPIKDALALAEGEK